MSEIKNYFQFILPSVTLVYQVCLVVSFWHEAV